MDADRTAKQFAYGRYGRGISRGLEANLNDPADDLRWRRVHRNGG